MQPNYGAIPVTGIPNYTQGYVVQHPPAQISHQMIEPSPFTGAHQDYLGTQFRVEQKLTFKDFCEACCGIEMGNSYVVRL